MLINCRLFLLLVSLVVLDLGSFRASLLRTPVVRFLIIWCLIILHEISLLIPITSLLLENSIVENQLGFGWLLLHYVFLERLYFEGAAVLAFSALPCATLS